LVLTSSAYRPPAPTLAFTFTFVCSFVRSPGTRSFSIGDMLHMHDLAHVVKEISINFTKSVL